MQGHKFLMRSNSIPASLLSKIGDYEIEINVAKVKVTVVDNFYVVSAKIDELEYITNFTKPCCWTRR